MPKALIISNNEVLNDIYKINLKVYTNVDCNIYTSIDDALSMLTSDEKFDLIITFSHIDDEDIAKQVYDKNQESRINTPLIVIGEKSEVSEYSDVTSLPGNFNVKKLLKTIANLLEITPADMMELEVPDYYPIPIKLLRNLKESICDVFMLVSKNPSEHNYVKVWQKGEPKNDLEKYLDQGFDTLFISKYERAKVVNLSTELLASRISDSDIDKETKLDVLEEGFEAVANTLTIDGEVSNEMVEISKQCIENISSTVKEFPSLKGLLMSMVSNKSSYLYTHMILATYVSKHIVENVSWGGEGHAEKVAFVLFFHDVHLVPVYNKYPDFKYEEDLVFNDIISDNDKDIVINHAHLASETIKSFSRAPMGADTIAVQHHGMTNGVGFTMDFKDDVSPLSKIIIVAEEFVEQVLKAKEEGGDKKLDDFIEHLRKKFTRHTYKKIIDTLTTIKF